MKKEKNYYSLPARVPFYYGWIVLPVCILTLLLSIPGQPDGIGVFKDSLISEYNISDIQFSTLFGISTVLVAFIFPFSGKLIDRVGVRKLVPFAVLLMSVMIISITVLPSLVHSDSASRFPALATLGIYVFVLRFCAQGCMGISSRITLGKWFSRRRGLATAVFTLVTNFGFNMSPFLLNRLVDWAGWIKAYRFVSIYILLPFSVFVYIFVRNTPEQCGLSLDEVSADNCDSEDACESSSNEKCYTAKQALRTFVFWVFLLGVGFQAMYMTSIMIHISSIGSNSQLTRNQTYDGFILISIFAMIANVSGGWLSDKFKIKYHLAFMLFAQIIATAGLFFFDRATFRMIFFIGYGLSVGLFSVLQVVAWPKLFGRKYLGEIIGFSMFFIVLLTSIGPFLFSLSPHYTGGYNCILVICMCVSLLIGVICLQTKDPAEPIEKCF